MFWANSGKQSSSQSPQKYQIPGEKTTVEVTVLYNENYKPLKKENGEDTRRWKDTSPMFMDGQNKYFENGYMVQ
jgi:hypothetical protein